MEKTVLEKKTGYHNYIVALTPCVCASCVFCTKGQKGQIPPRAMKNLVFQTPPLSSPLLSNSPRSSLIRVLLAFPVTSAPFAMMTGGIDTHMLACTLDLETMLVIGSQRRGQGLGCRETRA